MRIRNAKPFIILLLLVVTSCLNVKDDEDFERKSQLLNYLEEIQNIELEKNNIVVIISGHCGSCNQETISFLKKLEEDKRFSSFRKYILMPKENFHVIPNLKSELNGGFQILKDRNIKMLRYGILFSKNVFLEFNNYDNVKYWGWLHMEDIYTIESNYFKDQ